MRYYLSSLVPGPIAPDLVGVIESAVANAETHAEFQRAVEALTSRLSEETTRLRSEPLTEKVGTFSGEQFSIPGYVVNLLRRVGEIRILYMAEQRRPIGREEAARLLALKVRRGGSDVLRNIQATVADLLGVQIDAFESSSPQGRGEAAAELDVDNFLVEVNGSGVRDALRLILDVEFQNPDLLLVEEPETHLHPALETSMMRYLQHISQRCQVFISTHSTNFLDTGEMKNIYLVSKGAATEAQLISLADAEEAIPRELGIRLSSVFMFDRLIFIEGRSDEDVVREWADTLRINLGQQNLGFVAMGGVRNFAHFAAGTTMAFLTRRRVKIWFLLDRDERDRADILQLKDRLGDLATLMVFERREIENYLLVPRAIVELMKQKKEDSGGTAADVPMEADVARLLGDCAEGLKQFAIDKRVIKRVCSPVYPLIGRMMDEGRDVPVAKRVTDEIERMIEELGRAKGDVEGVVGDEASVIERVWQARKLEVVPGDELLDAVFRRTGLRFKKERDSARLAGLMQESEIPAEIRRVIQDLAR
jgi:hypothetical protein